MKSTPEPNLKGSSTTHCLVKLLNDVGSETDKLNQSGVIMATDFSKAFDRMNHLIVVEKFISLGVRPSIIPWICDFLSNRSQCVRIDGALSDWQTTNAGVPQGTKIGPIEFLAMINDCQPTSSAEVSQYKYVDDATLFFTIWEVR